MPSRGPEGNVHNQPDKSVRALARKAKVPVKLRWDRAPPRGRQNRGSSSRRRTIHNSSPDQGTFCSSSVKGRTRQENRTSYRAPPNTAEPVSTLHQVLPPSHPDRVLVLHYRLAPQPHSPAIP